VYVDAKGNVKEALMLHRSSMIVGLLLGITFCIPFGAAAEAEGMMFTATHYYIFSLGEVGVAVADLVETGKAAAFSVVIYGVDGTPSVERADGPPDEPIDVVLAGDRVLVGDGDRFLLRVRGEDFTYTVRPSAAGYELVVNPSRDLPMIDVLTTILVSLQEIGVIGAEAGLEYRSFAKSDDKGPTPPAGAALDSDLYSLVMAEDWFEYAAAKGFTRVGLRVEVVAEKLPGAALPDAYQAYATAETDQLVRLLLPIDEIVSLSRSSAIGYVRPPYQPAVP